MKTENDTPAPSPASPRTDRREYEEECNFYVSWVEFARTLELELQRKTAALEDLYSACRDRLPPGHLDKLSDEMNAIKQLREQPGAGA